MGDFVMPTGQYTQEEAGQPVGVFGMPAVELPAIEYVKEEAGPLAEEEMTVVVAAVADLVEPAPASSSELDSDALGREGGEGEAAAVEGAGEGDGADGARAKKKRRTPGVKVPRWSEEEEGRLRALVNEHGIKDWAKVAGALGSHRSPAGVDQHWQILSGKRRRNGKAAPFPETTVTAAAVVASSEALASAEGVAVTDVTVMVAEMSGAPPTPPSSKSAKRDRRSTGKVARWTQEEEEKLRSLVPESGVEPNWDDIAAQLGSARSAAGVDQHFQIMTGKRKSYYVSVADKRAQADATLAAPIAVATLETAPGDAAA